MKQIIIFFSLMFLLEITCLAAKPPDPVLTTFVKKFPTVNLKKINWWQENPQEFIADFVVNSSEYSVDISDKGLWIFTKKTIAFNQLPIAVQNTFMQKHEREIGMGMKIYEINHASGGIIYNISLTYGVVTFDFQYKPNGIEMKK